MIAARKLASVSQRLAAVGKDVRGGQAEDLPVRVAVRAAVGAAESRHA